MRAAFPRLHMCPFAAVVWIALGPFCAIGFLHMQNDAAEPPDDSTAACCQRAGGTAVLAVHTVQTWELLIIRETGADAITNTILLL